MRSIVKVVSIFSLLTIGSAVHAGEQRAKQVEELAALKAELKPLRERAALEPGVVAARKALDEAYRAYWDSVRAEMMRLDPSQKALIEREIALRKALSSVRPEQTGARKADGPSISAKKSKKSGD